MPQGSCSGSARLHETRSHSAKPDGWSLLHGVSQQTIHSAVRWLTPTGVGGSWQYESHDSSQGAL